MNVYRTPVSQLPRPTVPRASWWRRFKARDIHRRMKLRRFRHELRDLDIAAGWTVTPWIIRQVDALQAVYAGSADMLAHRASLHTSGGVL